jgi:hypothetical protein
MKTNHHTSPALALPPPAHRYQIFRQTRTGVYQRYGTSLESLETAVELFLETRPTFDGGGVRLWDYHEQRTLASAEWLVENTTFGFPVRVRADAFHDEAVSTLARHVLEREALIESLGQRVNLTN